MTNIQFSAQSQVTLKSFKKSDSRWHRADQDAKDALKITEKLLNGPTIQPLMSKADLRLVVTGRREPARGSYSQDRFDLSVHGPNTSYWSVRLPTWYALVHSGKERADLVRLFTYCLDEAHKQLTGRTLI